MIASLGGITLSYTHDDRLVTGTTSKGQTDGFRVPKVSRWAS